MVEWEIRMECRSIANSLRGFGPLFWSRLGLVSYSLAG